MSGDPQSRHCWRLMLVVSLAHIADVGSGYVGHSRSGLSAPPEVIRVPSGLNATLYTSVYVECAYGGFGPGGRQGADLRPHLYPSHGRFSKYRESYPSGPVPSGRAVSY